MASQATSTINRLTTGTIEITLTVPWVKIQQAYEKAVEEAVASAEIKGFRKGKAPRTMVEPKLDKNHTLSHAIQHVLPDEYAAAVKEHGLKPILYPQIAVQSGKEGEDWVFTASTCEAPQVTLPDYKSGIGKVEVKQADQKLSTILDYLVKNSKMTIPTLLIEEEANHRLNNLVENLTQLGMTTDKYLASKNLTPESLKAQMATDAKSALEVEFALMEVTRVEKLENRQKTLDFLSSLV